MRNSNTHPPLSMSFRVHYVPKRHKSWIKSQYQYIPRPLVSTPLWHQSAPYRHTVTCLLLPYRLYIQRVAMHQSPILLFGLPRRHTATCKNTRPITDQTNANVIAAIISKFS